MSLAHATALTVFYEPDDSTKVKVGRLAHKDRHMLFEYAGSFLSSGFELSPFKLKLKPGLTIGNPQVFGGLMGIFEDALPDGWGRLLIDRRAAKYGLSASALTPLDRLSLVGHSSMGALSFEPDFSLLDAGEIQLKQLADESLAVLNNSKSIDLDQLIAIGGSPKGARPKALIQMSPDGKVYFGAQEIQPGFTSWMVKFNSKEDHTHASALEHAYFLMAKAANIDVPKTQVLERTKRNPGYFAIERFDRIKGGKVHLHTLGGLLELPHGYPALDYLDLLNATRQLTRNEGAVAEMFRRACFNVFAHNRDDHSRNFSFLMNAKGQWNVSPAYDLTFSGGPGGEHSMLVAGEGMNPKEQHLMELAKKFEIKKAVRIFEQVRDAVRNFSDFAEQAGVPKTLGKVVAKVLKQSCPPLT
jgi:serine/threonine-protein kinase HipA